MFQMKGFVMPKFTVVLGDFDDFPGLWNECHVEAESAGDIDVQAVAQDAYVSLCDPHIDIDDDTDCGKWTLVGVYEGHIRCLRG
jgi:hypothetical protein